MRAFGYASRSFATQPERMVSATMLSPTASSRSSPPLGQDAPGAAEVGPVVRGRGEPALGHLAPDLRDLGE